MSDPKMAPPASAPRHRVALERWENEGGADDDPQRVPAPVTDLNALLAEEQTAIMSAEAATDPGLRDEQRNIAKRVRDLVDLTPFPPREPHDFDRLVPAEPGPPDNPDGFTAEFEALRQHVEKMEHDLALRFSEGKVGRKHNTFEHSSRLVRQARGRLADLGKSSVDTTSLYPSGSDPI